MDIENLRKLCEDSIMPIGNMEEYSLAKQLFQSVTFRSNVSPRDVLELIDEITTLRQQLAEQPNVDVLVEALEAISNWRFSWDGDCGVTSVADKALATYQAKNEKE